MMDVYEVPGKKGWFMDKPEADMVNHPPHYTQGNIEVIDFIIDQKLGYLDGNVVKYLCRAPHKGTKKQDHDKAQYYMNKIVEGYV